MTDCVGIMTEDSDDLCICYIKNDFFLVNFKVTISLDFNLSMHICYFKIHLKNNPNEK